MLSCVGCHCIHDMGLVGCFLQALYWQSKGVFMTPFQFLRTPRLWFDAITQFKGTLSAAPNFAYGMMARKFNPADSPDC